MNKKLLVALGCASLFMFGCEKNFNLDDYGLYYISNGNKYDVYSHLSISGEDEFQKEDITVDFSFPQVKYENDDIQAMNKEIQRLYNNVEEKVLAQDESGCVCIKLADDYHCGGEHLETQEYKVYETDKYLTIQVRTVGRTYCAGGYDDYYFFNISKKTEKRIDDNTIFSELNMNINAFSEAIKQEYQKEYDYNFNSFEFVKIGIVDEGKLIVVVPDIVAGMAPNNVYYYDGVTLTKNS